MPNDTKTLWSPAKERVDQTQLTRFARLCAAKYGYGGKTYADLHSWSINSSADFWRAVADFGEVKFSTPPQKVLEAGKDMMSAKWFGGARLNFAEHLLRHATGDNADKNAIVFCNDNRARVTITYAELRRQVAKAAGGFKDIRVGKGDVVAAYMPNQITTVVAMLAAASLGAIWSSCSPDFGLEGAVERLAILNPKVLVATAGYTYGGKEHNTADRSREIARRIGARHLFLVPYPGMETAIDSNLSWEILTANNATEVNFAPTEFDHPLYALFSSGTTGKPKCIVHGAGGTLLQHLKELVLHTDITANDTVFYFTTCGWMMWNWLVSGLATGATIVLYDGSPMFPTPKALWRLAEREQISVFGTSARYIDSLRMADFSPGADFNLAKLRAVLSTGSPLSADSFDYVYDHIKSDLMLSSISGGTDIVSCFVLGCPNLPVRRGEIQAIGLGMDIAFYNDVGKPVVDERGELVCRGPFPSMPVFFWGDDDRAKYRATYFSGYEGVWTHGDYGMLTKHGGVVLYGRSDTTLNPGGVRIGTAEIYRPLQRIAQITDAVAIGQEWQNDTRIVLFIVPKSGITLDEQLIRRIKTTIREYSSPRHVPAKIVAVGDIPRTVNGKVAEVAVRETVHGREVKNSAALINPEALRNFVNLKELKN